MRPFFALLISLFVLAPNGAAFAAAPPVDINVILPLTGSAAFLGTQEQRTLLVAESFINQQGGIRGRPVHFVIADDQSNPTVAVQLTSGVIAKGAAVIIGSAVSATCFAMQPLVDKSGPVQYCLSPAGRGAPGSYVFSASVGTRANASTLVRYFHDRGWQKIALITSTDATGQDFDKAVDDVLASPEGKSMSVVAREHFNPTDLSVSAQIARIKAAGPQALLTFTTGTPLGTVLRGIQESGLTIPVSAAAGNLLYPQMQQYKALLPEQLYFAATRGVAPDLRLRPGPIQDAQNRYFQTLKAAGMRSDYGSTLIWDPVMLVISALRAVGPDASAEQLRNWLLNLHGWAGIDGLYDFRDGSQKGLSMNAMVIYRWDQGRSAFVVSSGAAGAVRS
jgi:branched-chain amino acid transport system substrate-binding protein